MSKTIQATKVKKGTDVLNISNNRLTETKPTNKLQNCLDSSEFNYTPMEGWRSGKNPSLRARSSY